MLGGRPHLDFVPRCLQWPYIRPRSLPRLPRLLLAAGVERSPITLHPPDDGVHAVASIEV